MLIFITGQTAFLKGYSTDFYRVSGTFIIQRLIKIKAVMAETSWALFQQSGA